MVNLNFTPYFNSTELVHINSSYIQANHPPQQTILTVWLFFVALGFALLLISVWTSEPRAKDLTGVLATPIFLISAIQSFSVDEVTGYGVTNNANEYVMLENHTLHNFDFWGVFLAICFVICLLNLYLLWLDHKRVVNQEQEQMPGNKMSPRGGGVKAEQDDED